MRVTKLVVGILLVVLSCWLLIEGLFGGLVGLWQVRNIVSGILEIIMGGLMMGAGIVYICLENSPYYGGDITGLVLLLISGLCGIAGGFFNRWLFVYAFISLVAGIGFFAWHLMVGDDD
ncbi:hypothetical protein [uncultured Lactobacillus sp.]|uniref:hypothetical protein n=1 Tax=uncultured Lactobacillus sp. TaxID=153152 RepID=UPI00263115BF|nr:hypothetical protein [uncultured Lactobacillus sp.]